MNFQLTVMAAKDKTAGWESYFCCGEVILQDHSPDTQFSIVAFSTREHIVLKRAKMLPARQAKLLLDGRR